MREIQCKKCFFFTPEWCPKKRDSLDPDLIRDCQFYRTKTNADKIRQMSDEQLATWIHMAMHDPCQRNYYEWLDWLKQDCE